MSNQPSKPPAILRNPFPFASGVTRFEIKNLEQAWYSDLYHYLLAISWRRLLVVYFLIYLGTNALFGLLFWLGGDVRHNVRFVDMIDTKSVPGVISIDHARLNDLGPLPASARVTPATVASDADSEASDASTGS